jgi:hypothetical protein
MEGRAIIITSCWIAISVISSVYIWVGNVSLSTDIFVGILILLALIVTFGVGFGELDKIFNQNMKIKKSHDINETRFFCKNHILSQNDFLF